MASRASQGPYSIYLGIDRVTAKRGRVSKREDILMMLERDMRVGLFVVECLLTKMTKDVDDQLLYVLE